MALGQQVSASPCCLSAFALQVWDAVDSGRCLQTYSVHSEAVRAAQWSPCGQRILSGGFDFGLHLTDLETGALLCRPQGQLDQSLGSPRPQGVLLLAGAVGLPAV